MKAKFTRGPWAYEPFVHDGRVVNFDLRGADDANFYRGPLVGTIDFVARHDQCHVVGVEEAEANVRLAASAPELLDVVDAVVKQFTAAGVVADLEGNDPAGWLLAKALAARSKALDPTPAIVVEPLPC